MHQEGEQLIDAQRQRARAVLDDASEAELALLGSPAADDVRERAQRRPAVQRFRGDAGRVGNRLWPSGSRPASPGVSRRFPWRRTNPERWIRDS